MKFEDYKLPFGYPLALEGASAGGAPFKFASKIIGCIPGDVLILSHPRAAKASTLRSGQKILVTIMAGNGVLAFASVIDQIIAQPRSLVFLTYPTKLSFKEIRGATRVEIRVPIEASSLSGLITAKTSGVITDISTSGARIELTESIGDIGGSMELTGTVTIARLEERFNFPAIIRSRVERSTRESEAEFPAIYGIEFDEVPHSQRLLLYAFVYSLLATQ
ncbi:hypothetical protein R50072_06160 [Simiduia litorea]|uniref:flagellar brake protein n=1 Tax=Simiduia litorea TaxID=1435348 RepID=UPI0036F3D1CF